MTTPGNDKGSREDSRKPLIYMERLAGFEPRPWVRSQATYNNCPLFSITYRSATVAKCRAIPVDTVPSPAKARRAIIGKPTAGMYNRPTDCRHDYLYIHTVMNGCPPLTLDQLRSIAASALLPIDFSIFCILILADAIGLKHHSHTMSLDHAPYILYAAAAVVGAVLWWVRRRDQ